MAKDLADELGLSEDSVRRDLRELAAAGLCQRVYGGALPVSPAVADFAARSLLPWTASRDWQRPGHAGLFPAARSCSMVAPRRSPWRGPCPRSGGDGGDAQPDHAGALLEHPRVEVYLLGGRLFRHSAVTCGGRNGGRARIQADLFLLGVTGVHAGAGLTTGDPDEAAMKRTLSRREPTPMSWPAARRSARPPPSGDGAGRRHRHHHRRFARAPHAGPAPPQGNPDLGDNHLERTPVGPLQLIFAAPRGAGRLRTTVASGPRAAPRSAPAASEGPSNADSHARPRASGDVGRPGQPDQADDPTSRGISCSTAPT